MLNSIWQCYSKPAAKISNSIVPTLSVDLLSCHRKTGCHAQRAVSLTWNSSSVSLLNSSWVSCSALPWCIRKAKKQKNKLYLHVRVFVFSLCCPPHGSKKAAELTKWREVGNYSDMFSSGYALPVWYRLKVCLHSTCTYTVISVKWWVKSTRVTTGNHPHLCYFIIIFFLRFAFIWSWCQTQARQHCALAGMSAQFP